MYKISFAEAKQALQTANVAVSVAEGHGCLCGAFCTLPQFSSHSWLQELLPDPAAGDARVQVEPIHDALIQLHNETQAALQGDAMEFIPLLPDDSAPISERIAALAQWSQGFLYGFGIGAPRDVRQSYPDEVTEVLKDLSEIAKADEVAASGSDDEEQAYTELVEYLRAAVQLIHDDLAEQRAERVQYSPVSH